MSKATVTKFKWFWHDQDVEQEQWLRQMAAQGLHLRSVAGFLWGFERGAPADMVYRVDYRAGPVPADYVSLLEDAGWQRAAASGGWQYWRIAAAAGQTPALFTDQASRRGIFSRLLPVMFLCLVPTMMFLINPAIRQQMASDLSWPFKLLYGAGLLVVMVAIGRLLLRLWRLRQPS